MRTNAVKLFEGVATSMACATTAASWWFYTGPYRWFSELQMQVLGEYYVKLSLIATLLAVGLIWVLPVRLFVGKSEARVIPCRDARNLKIKPVMIAGFLLPTAAALVMGALYADRVASDKKLRMIDAASLRSATFGPGYYFEVQQRTLPGVEYGDSHGSSTLYMPVVPEDWMPGEPINLIVSVYAFKKPEGDHPYLRGMRWPGGLPGPVRVAFENGGAQISNAVFVCADESPSSWEEAEGFMLAGAAIAGLIGTVCGVLAWRQRATNSDSSPHQTFTST